MVALNQNMLYIIIAVVVIAVIVLAVFLRRRRSKEGPSNVNKFLADEAYNVKIKIAKELIEPQSKNLHLKIPQDDLNDIRETTSQLEHKNAYFNSKIEDKVELLKTKEKQLNLQKQLKEIDKRKLKLDEIVKPKEGK